MQAVIKKFKGLTNQQKQDFLKLFDREASSTVSDAKVLELYGEWQKLSQKEQREVFKYATNWEDKFLDKMEKLVDKLCGW